MDTTGELTLNLVSYNYLSRRFQPRAATQQTNIQLPLPVNIPGEDPIYDRELNAKIYAILNDKLLNEWNVYVALFFHGDTWWCRCSAQVWNEVRRICHEL